MKYLVMSYNIERMKDLFKSNKIRQGETNRASAIAETIYNAAPHILGIVEASDKTRDHEHFLTETKLADLNYQIGKSHIKRGKQDLVFYFREPFEIVHIDKNVEFYKSWIEDIDGDSIEEVLKFERKPLEVVFRNKNSGQEVMVILLSFKSKGVFSVSDIYKYQHLALANRKKLHAQSKKVRERIDQILENDPDRAIIIMGDLNDEIGMDYFQKQVGASAVETITGNIHEPHKIIHNTLYHLYNIHKPQEMWTTEYPDPIVANSKNHRAWLDHIFVSPGMLHPNSSVKYIMNSGNVIEKNGISKIASDHYPVFCHIEM